jgi:hypothetical protein
MIILFAMKNSLAARARTRRRPEEPFDRAARGVCVGDGGEMKTQNRRLGGADRQLMRGRRSAHRCRCGGKAAVTREGHRQPKTRAQLASSPFEQRVFRANATIQAAPPAQVRLQRVFGLSPRTPVRTKCPFTGKATKLTGRQPAPASSARSRKPPSDGWHLRRSPWK